MPFIRLGVWTPTPAASKFLVPISSLRALAFPPCGRDQRLALYRQMTSHRDKLSELQSFLYVQTPAFARYPGHSYSLLIGGAVVAFTAEYTICCCLSDVSAMLSVQNGQLTERGLSPRKFSGLMATPHTIWLKRIFNPMSPAVSVIIPTYNRAHLIDRAVRSVLNQTFDDYELLVVDDGSTDGTENLRVFKNPHLRYLRLPEKRGVSAARNAGVKATSAPLLAFLDSDDEWLPHKLEKQVRWMADHPKYRIVQTLEIWLRRGKRVNPPKTHEKFQGDLFSTSIERCMITPSSVVLTRSLFEETGGFNESLHACEDYDLWLKITCRYPVGLVDEYLLTRYGGHDDQLSSSVPVLDRFRITGLIDLLESGCLTPEQERLARENLLKRARIVGRGSYKHGNKDDYERYQDIIRRFS
jgi:glycosyltransferase involved in cell wall biosynthesis